MKRKEMKVLNELSELCNYRTELMERVEQNCERLIEKYKQLEWKDLVEYYQGEKQIAEYTIDYLKELGDKIAELIKIGKKAE